MDFVTIVTPNFAHFAPAMMALDNGFHVVIEKPITFTLDEAKQLKKKVEETGLILCLTHTYSGYPMVKQARAMVKDGTFGKIRKVYGLNIRRDGSANFLKGKAMPRQPGEQIRKKAVRAVVWEISEHMPHISQNISPA